jgi:hypothetical protein
VQVGAIPGPQVKVSCFPVIDSIRILPCASVRRSWTAEGAASCANRQLATGQGQHAGRTLVEVDGMGCRGGRPAEGGIAGIAGSAVGRVGIEGPPSAVPQTSNEHVSGLGMHWWQGLLQQYWAVPQSVSPQMGLPASLISE